MPLLFFFLRTFACMKRLVFIKDKTRTMLVLTFVVVAVGLIAIYNARDMQPKRGHTAFYNDIVLKSTPVLDQQGSPLCWINAMLATIETDRLQLGDSVTLSPDYLARRFMEEQSVPCFFTCLPKEKEKQTADDGEMNMRGTATTALRLASRYGVLPFDSYFPEKSVDWTSLARKAMTLARSSSSLTKFKESLGNALDRQAGYLPTAVHMLGATYTPLEFAHSLFLPGDYVALSSCTHHPFYSRFVLECPDNHYNDSCLNVPLDRMMPLIDRALEQGHAVCWEGCISNDGFDWKRCQADVSVNERDKMGSGRRLQDYRQRLIEHRKVTDDHAMCIVGRAHTPDGRRWYLAKNSWGKTNGLRGYMYLSKEYLELYTVAIVLHR